jgi:arabinose-5-phosphate isomerase
MADQSLPSINAYLDNLSGCLDQLRKQAESLGKAAELIAGARGIITLGVGKSGYIAQKLAASLRSISLVADSVHAGEALHGDLGRFRRDDLVVVFSKSGNSDELKTILPLLRKRGVRMIAITNRPASVVGTMAELVVDTGVETEGDHLNMLPLISTDVSLVVADIIVSLVADRIGLTPGMFREAHPGGQLGFAVGLALRDLTSWQARGPFVRLDTKVFDATLVMSKFRAGIVCVTDDAGKLLGILSDGDLRAALAEREDLGRATVARWMNKHPRVLQDSMSVADALSKMEMGERKVFAAPVLDAESRCLGVVTIHDLVR